MTWQGGRRARGFADSRCVLSQGLAQTPVLDVLCSQFVLTLTLHQAGRFNLRRDWNSLLSLLGGHLGAPDQRHRQHAWASATTR